MSLATDDLLKQALTLSPEDRVRVASDLLASLDDEQTDPAEVESLWSGETERRAAQIASGAAPLTTWERLVEKTDDLRASPPHE